MAAGPIPGGRFEGMTIVRLGPQDVDVDIEVLATEDDLCVAGGHLAVTVRPWSVMFTGSTIGT